MEPRELEDRVAPEPPRDPLQALLPPPPPRLPPYEDERLEAPEPYELPPPRVDGVALAPREPAPPPEPAPRVDGVAEAPAPPDREP